MSKIVTFRKNSESEAAAEALRILEAAWAYYTPERGEAEEVHETELEQMFDYYAA
ncbi:hypothetical protein C8J27_103387 [Rhodobacter aestuarii]|uniref:Uncharacterized protein n=1 Tax=Rhodobacter aestuarii TaxID=453582 RepID=A0A1N7JNJ0_9RHOB|nr:MULTISPECIES: hypothetical protein [Rhodobacter]PTV96055.1 hypothetical protein C8J27_103387 [Rhodobacter aestuarii]SIS50933.1 hypothetical protein SAMN05421580_10248 [Rhodobacter aestuarii]SOC09994.1 hypothetical protein SAMN05877809_10546 [Rhodobacter sp. JA431]